MAAYEVLLLNTAIPQIQAAQSGDTYVVPRDIAINASASITGNLGVGTSSPAGKLSVNVDASTQLITFRDSSGRQIWAHEPGGNARPLTIKAQSLTYADDSATRLTVDTSGNLGLGVTSPGVKLDIKQSAANWYDGLRIVRSTNDNQRLALGNTSGSSYIVSVDAAGGTNNELLFGRSTNGTTFSESARFTSGGDWLVGTTTSSGRLTVQTDGTSGSVGFIRNTDNTFTTDLDFIKSRGSTASPTAVQDGDNLLRLRVAPYQGSAYTYLNSMAVQVDGTFTSGQNPPTRIVWNTNAANGSATERMRLDASGNLGLGVTPSAWASSWRALQTLGGNSFYSDSTVSALASNAIYDGVWKYVNTAGAGTYQINRNAHNWYIAPSGTAGNAITFTQAMTLDASGNLKVGGTANRATTAGTNHLDIFNGTAPVGTLTNGISIYSSSGEAYVMDAAGNATLFSPHDAETNEWIFKSKHTPTGKVLKIDVERLLKFINDHFGLDAVHEFVEE